MSLSERKDLSAEEIEESQDVSPARYQEIDLGEDRDALEKWLLDHYRNIVKAMQPVLERFHREKNQFSGDMPGADYPYPGAFRVNYPVTKNKTRQTTNKIKKALLESEPLWAVDIEDDQLVNFAQDMEVALDSNARHEVRCEADFSQAIFESVLHGAGFLAPGWEYDEDVQRDVEEYQGVDGAAETLEERIASLKDLARFEKNYPNWQDEPEAIELHRKIAAGQDVRREVSYTIPVRNNPDMKFIDAERVRVYPNVDGYEGLRSTPVYGFITKYTRSELEDLERDGLIDEAQLDKLLTKTDTVGAEDQQDEYEIFECTIRYELEGDERPARYEVWMDAEKGIILRIRGYRWFFTDPNLIPIYSRTEEPGFFKTGFAEDLKEIHIILVVVLNMFLNSADMSNAMKFKVKQNSLAEQFLLSRRWSPHMGLPWKNDPSEVDPMVTSPAPINALVTAFELLRRQSDEETQTSSLQSGRESPTDPTAPASKVAMLLQQVEPNTTEMIRSMESGFRQAGKWLIWLYYQGLRLNWIDEMPGMAELPVELLPEVAEKLNPRAMLFESDRAGRQERNIAVMKLFGEVFPGNQRLMAQVFKRVLKQMDSYWSREAENIPFDELVQDQQPPQGGPQQPGVLPQNEIPGNPGGNGVPSPAREAVANAL